MAKKLGRLMLIQIEVSGSFQTIAALNSKTLSINNAAIDVTTPDYDNPNNPLWVELLAGAKSIAASGSGYAKKQSDEAALTAIAMSTAAIEVFKIVVPNVGAFEGPFMVGTNDLGGEQEDGVTFGLSLSSAGEIAFTPES